MKKIIMITLSIAIGGAMGAKLFDAVNLPSPEARLEDCYDDAATTTEQCDDLQDAGVL